MVPVQEGHNPASFWQTNRLDIVTYYETLWLTIQYPAFFAFDGLIYSRPIQILSFIIQITLQQQISHGTHKGVTNV